MLEPKDMDALQYPIGRYKEAARFDRREIEKGIEAISALPGQVRASVAGLSDADLEKRYRPGGWSVRQLAYHLADSHTHN